MRFSSSEKRCAAEFEIIFKALEKEKRKDSCSTVMVSSDTAEAIGIIADALDAYDSVHYVTYTSTC